MRQKITAIAMMATCTIGIGSAKAEEVSLRTGESADVAPAYWVEKCQSILKSFAGVDVLDGPPGISLSIRESEVNPRRQNCPGKVSGGMVVVTANEVQSKISTTLKYRVRYNTEDGPKQSTHSIQLSLLP